MLNGPYARARAVELTTNHYRATEQLGVTVDQLLADALKVAMFIELNQQIPDRT